MKVLVLVFILAGVSAANADNSCFNSSILAERKEVFSAFRSKKYDELDRRFHEMCGKFPDKLECSVETVVPSNVKTITKELIAKGPCTEVLSFDLEKMTKIYFINDKTVPSKK